MFIQLVDSLRCVRAHADTWLVASIEHAEDRDIKAGFLGCPTCLAEYQIRDGVVYFVERAISSPFVAPDENEGTRIAAVLDLTEPRMTALLHGRWAAHAPLIRALSPSQLLLLDPPEGLVSGDGISIVVADIAPLAAASLHAAAVDTPVSDELFASLRRSLRAGARLLASAALSVPDGFTEIARDEDVWVARLDDTATVSAPIQLSRRVP